MGKLLAINISKERGTEKREVPQAELVADYGIMGDAHAGKWHRQVSRQTVSFALCYLQEDGRVHYAKGGRVCSSHKRRSDSYR